MGRGTGRQTGRDPGWRPWRRETKARVGDDWEREAEEEGWTAGQKTGRWRLQRQWGGVLPGWLLPAARWRPSPSWRHRLGPIPGGSLGFQKGTLIHMILLLALWVRCLPTPRPGWCHPESSVWTRNRRLIKPREPCTAPATPQQRRPKAGLCRGLLAPSSELRGPSASVAAHSAGAAR